MTTTLKGRGVGLVPAAGPVYALAPPPGLPPARVVSDVAAEQALAANALGSVSADLAQRAESTDDSETSAVLEAISMIAADPELAAAVEANIDGGSDAAHAVKDAFETYATMLESAGGYMAERAADLRDLANRAIAHVLGVPMPGVPEPGVPFVLTATDLAPADTAGLDPASVLAIVTELGGATSHTAILARALGIPCVVGCDGILDLDDGTVVVVRPDFGSVTVDVDEATVAAVGAEAAELRDRLDAPPAPGATADGHKVELLRNIGSEADLADVTDDDEGYEGVGLFRTEFLFLDHQQAPTVDEQKAAYVAVLRRSPGRKVVVRTLDSGADKPLPFLDVGEEENPALGVRGLRAGRRFTEVLDAQLEALAAAQTEVPEAKLWVMAPMVATAEEAAWFADRARGFGLTTVGVMVEVPAAAMEAAELLEHVDFLSIGSNDLSQYLFAADRMLSDLGSLLEPSQPALLKLIGHVAAAGRAAGKPVGICGVAAAEPSLTTIFTGLGITSLSMASASRTAVQATLGAATLADCQTAAAPYVP